MTKNELPTTPGSVVVNVRDDRVWALRYEPLGRHYWVLTGREVGLTPDQMDGEYEVLFDAGTVAA